MSNATTHGYLYSLGASGTAAYNFGGNLRGLAYDQKNNLVYVVDMGKNHTEVFHVNPAATSNPAEPAPMTQMSQSIVSFILAAWAASCCAAQNPAPRPRHLL